MADSINERLEGMVPALNDLEQKCVFSREEIRKILDKRRMFEYNLLGNPELHAYLSYIQYENALEQCRRERKRNLNIRKRTLSDYAGIKHIISIFERAVSRKFKGDLRLWWQYLDFCLESGSVKQLQSVLIKVLRFHPTEERLWIFSADREMKLGHIKAARNTLLRGLRFIPKSLRLWQQLLKLECLLVAHIQKKAAASATQGGLTMPEDGTIEKKDQYSVKASVLQPASEGLAEGTEELPKTVTPQADMFGAISVVLRNAKTKLEQVDEIHGQEGTTVCNFLVFAWNLTAELLRSPGLDKRGTHGWTDVLQNVRLSVDELRQKQLMSAWKAWWVNIGPRCVKKQAEVLLAEAKSDDILAEWIARCPRINEAVDMLFANERIRHNPKAMLNLPLDSIAIEDCLREWRGKDSPYLLSLNIKMWSKERPSADKMLAVVEEIKLHQSVLELSAGEAFLHALPAERRLEGFLRIAFWVEPCHVGTLVDKLLTFQITRGKEDYKSCIDNIVAKITSDGRNIKYPEHVQEILYRCLLLAEKSKLPQLDHLFTLACDTEKDPQRRTDLWARYEHYVEQEGGDASKVRWRATSAKCCPQDISEQLRKLRENQ